MKVWLENYFSRYFFENLNLKDVGIYVRTWFSNIDDEFKDWFDVELEDEEDDCKVVVPYTSIDEMLIDGTEYEYCDWTDELEYLDIVNSLVKDFPHYLVCAYNSNWMGQTAYKFENNMMDALSRDYDTHMYVVGGSKGGKSVMISESSHDVPMGADTIIIGLTEKEFDKLSNSCYNTIIDFADEKSKSIIRF